MARDGYLIIDSDMHFNEPDDLWARYLDEPYRANPPRFFGAQQQKLTASAVKMTMSPYWRTLRRMPMRRRSSCRAISPQVNNDM